MIGHTDGSVLNDDSECPGRDAVVVHQRSGPAASRPSPRLSDAPPAGPDELRLDRTRVLEVIPGPYTSFWNR